MKTFIRAMESWVPGDDRGCLVPGGGWYQTPAFGAMSQRHVFAWGEGLPGRAWEEGEPVILTQFEGSYFRRAGAARAVGLTSAIAVPMFLRKKLAAVLVIFCGGDEERFGAIELWRNAPDQSPDMTLVDGYYGATEEAFGFASRKTTFRKGIGLPGLVWERNEPVFMPDLGKADRFLRAQSALKVGINRGLGIPCDTQTGANCVLTFLSANSTPIARRFEIWSPDSGYTLRRGEGFCETAGTLHASADGPTCRVHQGAIGRTFATGVPSFVANPAAEVPQSGAELEEAGVETLIALPLTRAGAPTGVLAWYF